MFYSICYNTVMNAYEFMKKAGELTSKNQQHYYDFAKAHGVNYNTLAVLYTCYVNKACTQKQVTIEWYVPKQTVNTICKELIAEGLLSKVRGDKDHRETIIRLTEKGIQKAAPIVEQLLRIESNIVESMGEDKSREFLKIYSAYSNLLDTEFSKEVD